MQRSTGAAWEDCEPTGTGGDVTYSALSVSQLINEIKGWPAVVNTGDLDALNLWWDKVGTPTTAPTVTDTSVAGLTDNYERCIKVVTDAASEGMSQRFTYADEPRVKAGRTISALLAIWSVGAVSVTAKLLNSDASETAAAAVTAAAWTIVEVPAHVLAGTYVDLQITAGAAGTFYVVPLGMNIGSRAFPLRARGLRWVEAPSADLVSNVDPGAAVQTVDLTANTSNLAARVAGFFIYQNTAGVGYRLAVRRNGDTTAIARCIQVVHTVITAGHTGGAFEVDLDDGQNLQYLTDGAVGNAESVYMAIRGYWEWE